MPIFNYRCSVCGREDERLVHRRDLQHTCKLCGGVMIKIPSKSSFILKGDGWTGKENE